MKHDSTLGRVLDLVDARYHAGRGRPPERAVACQLHETLPDGCTITAPCRNARALRRRGVLLLRALERGPLV